MVCAAMNAMTTGTQSKSRCFAIRIFDLDSIRGLMRGRILYGDSRDVERAGNFQNVPRLDSMNFTSAVTGRLDREIGVPSKTHTPFDQCCFASRFKPQSRQNDAAVAQRERSFARRPARLARARLALCNT